MISSVMILTLYGDFLTMAATASKCTGELINFPIKIRAGNSIIGKTELKTNFPQGRWQWKIFPLQVATVGCPVGIVVALING